MSVVLFSKTLFRSVAKPSSSLSRLVTMARLVLVKLEFSTRTWAPMRELMPEVSVPS